MRYIAILGIEVKIIRIFIYLLLGTIFALLNLYFIDFGTSLIRFDMMERFNQGNVLSLGDKIVSVVFDIALWPLVIWRNSFVYNLWLCVLFSEAFIGVWLVRTRFRIVEVIKEVIRGISV